MRICTAKFIFLDTPQKKEKNELDRKEKKLCALGLNFTLRLLHRWRWSGRKMPSYAEFGVIIRKLSFPRTFCEIVPRGVSRSLWGSVQARSTDM